MRHPPSSAARPRVLVGAEDPGAANALAPVVALLAGEGLVDVRSACGPMAARVFARFAVPSLPEAARDARAWLDETHPELLLLGTSEGQDSIDRRLHRAARRAGLPTVCLLDYWSQFVERFSEPGPAGRLALVPDEILVMDGPARDALMAAGIPADRLVVTGHPYLDIYAEQTRVLTAEEQAACRRDLGFAAGSTLITFVSETFGWTCDETARMQPLSASRERTVVVLEHLLHALSALTPAAAGPLALVVKLHPKNRPEEFAWMRETSWPFEIRIVGDTDNGALLQASHLVAGMTSMLLVEASCLGAPTLSILPRVSDDDIGPGLGPHGIVARTAEELHARLADLLAGAAARQRGALDSAHRGATRRVADRLYHLVGVNQGEMEVQS